LKEYTEKNNTFKQDVLTAIKEIKDICRTNSTSINKLSDELNILKDDFSLRLNDVNRNSEENMKLIAEYSNDLNNYKSQIDKELFDLKSESGFLNKSIKKLMYDNEQNNINFKQNFDQQQEY